MPTPAVGAQQELIASIELSGTGDIVFTGIPQTFNTLEIILSGQGDISTNYDYSRIRVNDNSDSSVYYTYSGIYQNATTVLNQGSYSGHNEARMGDQFSGYSNPAYSNRCASIGRWLMQDYADTSKDTMLYGYQGPASYNAAPYGFTNFRGAFIDRLTSGGSALAVNKIRINFGYTFNTGYRAGSACHLYGWP